MIETYRGESFQFASFAEAGCHSASDTKHEHLNRHGAEVARGAHNSEGTGSKPVAGIHSNSAALQKLVVIAQATLNMSNT